MQILTFDGNKTLLMRMLTFLSISILFAFSSLGQQTVAAKQSALSSQYDIQDSILISTRDGVKISAIMVKRKTVNKPLPVILQFTIYVRDQGRDMESLKELADSGYVGVIAYTRGKRFSTAEILPYEHDANDVHDVIDWISKQSWCNGSIGMFGGSYNGFTQWAACKRLHPALKTIVPYVANRPGMGLPMENNVFINPNYEWSFYVGSNRYLDTTTGNDRQRFRNMMFNWWYSGAAYNKMDSIDGQANRLFQRWISHPSFDEYWRNMAPHGTEFAKINIPVLAIDGYYNDSQNSGIYYLKELEKYNASADFYLIIGPYSHFGAQREGESVLNGYSVDAHALINTKKITFDWFKYIFKDGPKPAILKDRINYQVMGADEWRSAPAFRRMNNETLTLYLSNEKTKDGYKATKLKPKKAGFLEQEVDFRDRNVSNNNYYPSPIIRDFADTSNGFNFISQPFADDVVYAGSFTGEIKLTINKRDVDVGITLYEVLPNNGGYFHLAYFIGRASYAKDMSTRQLLQPGATETITFTNTHIVSKKLRKGSRLLVHLNVNKNPFSDLNYGTGKPVSTETIADADVPLQIKWHNESFVQIPIWKN